MNELSNLRKFVAPEYVYGFGSRHLLSQYAHNFSFDKILLVTDNGVKKACWIDEIKSDLISEGFEVTLFDNISPNPRDYEIMQGVKVFEENNCDSIIAVGGGSVMDCAKGIGISSANKQHILEFEGVDQVNIPSPPLICLPTTAGSSADVSQFCIVTDSSRKLKIAIISKTTIPDVALVDPEMTISMPLTLSVQTGLDALTHAVEAYVSNASSPMSDINALESIRLIYKYMPKVFENPNNEEFRNKMMLASLYAGLAFSNASLGGVHAMAHSLGGLKDLPHGLCNTILLDKVMNHNFDSNPNKFRHIAQIFNLKTDSNTSQYIKTDLAKFMKDFKKSLNIDKGFGEFGLVEKEISQLAHNAINDPCIVTNPRKLSINDLKALYEQSI
ncbi:alcohol dehydrogenase-like regulatory protein ErcA [Sulfurospirillum arcachonense]|uniref:alcohol dehydrogenase-like regulatory protein ErcA n=1 Tax=Sulfurospirillum arcachonense TaxID=57666 RepID=UPI0004AD4E8F|nr:alcohol dehydrogenase-like regulatory protein ErcA [Sulfurospirillum arcachonense]